MCHGARHSSAGRLTAEEVFYYNKNVTLYLYSVFFFFVCFANQPAVVWTDLKVTVLSVFFLFGCFVFKDTSQWRFTFLEDKGNLTETLSQEHLH